MAPARAGAHILALGPPLAVPFPGAPKCACPACAIREGSMTAKENDPIPFANHRRLRARAGAECSLLGPGHPVPDPGRAGVQAAEEHHALAHTVIGHHLADLHPQTAVFILAPSCTVPFPGV